MWRQESRSLAPIRRRNRTSGSVPPIRTANRPWKPSLTADPGDERNQQLSRSATDITGRERTERRLRAGGSDSRLVTADGQIRQFWACLPFREADWANLLAPLSNKLRCRSRRCSRPSHGWNSMHPELIEEDARRAVLVVADLAGGEVGEAEAGEGTHGARSVISRSTSAILGGGPGDRGSQTRGRPGLRQGRSYCELQPKPAGRRRRPICADGEPKRPCRRIQQGGTCRFWGDRVERAPRPAVMSC